MLRRGIVLTLALAIGVLAGPARSSADRGGGGGPDELHDEAEPGVAPADDRPRGTPPEMPGNVMLTAAPAGFAIEDFQYDELVLKGYAKDVCAGRLLPGTGWAFNEIVARFGGTPGSMYSCRERWDVANNPDCNGTVVNPAVYPFFKSTCWSNHARGRAFDVMVGTSGTGYNRTRGIAIVNWLLAADAQGNVNARARQLGVQQILFADRCWNSDGDRGIAAWASMRQCGIGHHDHIHVDMTIRGANGTVAYWGSAPSVAPKPDTTVFWDFDAGWRQAVSWWNLKPTDEEGLGFAAHYDQAIVGDWDSNGWQGEVFLWDRDTGDYVIQEWRDGDSLNARIGSFTTAPEQIVAGDWDSDGKVDDMFIWDADTGRWNIISWDRFTPLSRRSGQWTTAPDQFIAGDFDGNGRVDDMFVWDQNTGKWNVFSWKTAVATYRTRGSWSAGIDHLFVGDWSAGGDLDESIAWNSRTGAWSLHKWSNFRPTYVRGGAWSPTIDAAGIGDFDTDGRVDDIFLYDAQTGKWSLISFHRNVPRTVRSNRWAESFDFISVGPFNE